MKPTKSILCHRSNSGLIPSRPLSRRFPRALRSLGVLLRRPSPAPRSCGVPPLVPPPSRSPGGTSLPPSGSPLAHSARLLPQRVRFCRGLDIPLSRPRTARETSTITGKQPRLYLPPPGRLPVPFQFLLLPRNRDPPVLLPRRPSSSGCRLLEPDRPCPTRFLAVVRSCDPRRSRERDWQHGLRWTAGGFDVPPVMACLLIPWRPELLAIDSRGFRRRC